MDGLHLHRASLVKTNSAVAACSYRPTEVLCWWTVVASGPFGVSRPSVFWVSHSGVEELLRVAQETFLPTPASCRNGLKWRESLEALQHLQHPSTPPRPLRVPGPLVDNRVLDP